MELLHSKTVQSTFAGAFLGLLAHRLFTEVRQTRDKREYKQDLMLAKTQAQRFKDFAKAELNNTSFSIYPNSQKSQFNPCFRKDRDQSIVMSPKHLKLTVDDQQQESVTHTSNY